MKISIKETDKEHHRWWHFLWTKQDEQRQYVGNSLNRICYVTICHKCGYTKVIDRVLTESK